MKRDVLWFVVAAIGVCVVIALSNAGSDSRTNAVLTLGFGGGCVLLAFRAVWRIERQILQARSVWTPSAIVLAGFIALGALQVLGMPTWGLGVFSLVIMLYAWVRGARQFMRREHPRGAP